MKNGYRLFWSDQAVEDLKRIIDYLTERWTQRELQNFARRLDFIHFTLMPLQRHHQVTNNLGTLLLTAWSPSTKPRRGDTY